MLAKRTVKNQITPPKAVVTRFAGLEFLTSRRMESPLCFAHCDKAGPMRCARGWPIDEHDVAAAVSWAREER